MGYAVWAVLTACALLAGYAVAVRSARGRGVVDRALTTLLVSIALVLGPTWALALAGVLNAWTLGVTSLGAFAVAVFASTRGEGGWRTLRETFIADLGAPRRLLVDILERQELAVFGLLTAAMAILVSLWIALWFPSWSWDVVWYHLPLTNIPVQEGALRWEPTNIWYINGYPRNVEYVSIWNVLFPHSTALDDVAQFPFALLGGLAVAALCRRHGASPALSASLGGMWIALPAVALQLHTTHADIAAGALFVTAFYFLTERRFAGYARWMAMLALGLYIGTKVTGLFHAALLAPVFAVRLVREVLGAKGRRGRALASIAASLVLVVGLGGFIYVRNTFEAGNPFYPARVKVPLFGTTLPGEIAETSIAGPPAFFRADGAFTGMLRKWYLRSDNYYPDVREGPFGLLFPWLGLPALVLMTLLLPLRRDRWQLLALPAMATLAVLVPASWWGRFVLGAPAAGLVSIAVLHGMLRYKVPQSLLSAAASVLAVVTFAHGVQGYRALPRATFDEAKIREDEARLRVEAPWMWPPEAVTLRETELRPGDVVTYDSATSFLGEYWTRDLRNRVVYVDHAVAGGDETWLQQLRDLRPRWVSVRGRSRAETLLRERPHAFERLFSVPVSPAVMYRVTSQDY